MKYRDQVIFPLKLESANFTETIPINQTDPISMIKIVYKAVNASDTPTGHPVLCLSKIEIMDGGDMIVSGSGAELQAASIYQRGRNKLQTLDYASGEQCITDVDIYFGRWLWDSVYALDPKRFKQLSIRITGLVAVGGSVPTSGYLGVFAKTFADKAVSPVGCLQYRETINYALVASTDQNILLPVDKTIRAVYILSRAAGNAPYQQYHHIRLSENNDAKVPMDMDTSDIVRDIVARYPPLTELVDFKANTSAVTVYLTATYQHTLVATGRGTASEQTISGGEAGGNPGLVHTAAQYVSGMAHGFMPHGALILPFGNPDDDTDWYDMGAIQQLQLRLTAGSGIVGSSTCQVMTENVRRY